MIAQFATNAMRAATNFSKARTAADRAKASLISRLVEAAVAKVAADEVDGKAAARWLGEVVVNDGCKATLASYRSAISWRLDSATVADIRAQVGPISAYDDEADAVAAVVKVAEGLGDVWQAYKARPKAEKAVAAPEPKTEAGRSSPAPEEKAPDPEAMAADMAKAALDAIAYLIANGRAGELDAIRAALEVEVEDIAEAA